MFAKKKLKTHKQSKYFTLMLVPYSSGKTRSVKIPYLFLQAFFGSIIGLLVISAGLSYRTNYYIDKANYYNENLEESKKINSELMKEQIEIKTDIELQKMSYEEKLLYYKDKVNEFDEKIEELDKAKDSIYDTLSKKTKTDNIAFMSGSVASDINYSSDDLDLIFVQLEQKLNNEMAAYDELIGKVEEAKPYLDRMPNTWPVRGRITSGFGNRANPFTGRGSEFHSGIDIKVGTGTSVSATGGGKVIYAGWQNGYGYLVGISHINGVSTYYAHNSNVLVNVGDYVNRGDVVAKSGNTGRSTGPHVHYEIRLNGVAVNPMNYIEED